MSGLKKIQAHLLVCEHKTCLKQGGRDTVKELKHALKEAHIQKHVMISKVDCLDQCGRGPIVVVYPDGIWYGEVDERAAREIVAQHIKEGKIFERNVLHQMDRGKSGVRSQESE